MRAGINGVDTSSLETWACGDYARVGNLWLLVSELLCEAVDIRSGQHVLDVATGSGNTALAAKRRFGVVTGIDYVPALLEEARTRAAADRLEITFEAGDAECMRYSDDSFDVVVSTFGVMYAPDHQRAAAELIRVVRPGGRIGLASWTPDGYMGRLLHLIAEYASPSAGSPSATLWGTREHIDALFGEHMSDLQINERHWNFRFSSTAYFIDYFRTHFGPLGLAFATLDTDGQHALTVALTELITGKNICTGDTIIVPSSYLEVIATTAIP